MKKNGKTPLPPTLLPRLSEASAASRAAKKLSLPADAVMSLPHLSLTGNRELSVDGVKSVTEYDETGITLSCGKISVTVTGINLVIERYFADSAVITGVLTGLSFF